MQSVRKGGHGSRRQAGDGKAPGGGFVIGTDTGGTFTDITVLADDGRVFIDKAPTTPRDFSTGVLDAVFKVSRSMGLEPAELLGRTRMLKHGSTVATNALITREGARVGFITTKGFEDTTLIMRAIGRVAGLGEEEIKHQATAVKPEPLVPRELIRGVTERVDFRGNVVIPINMEEARDALRELVEQGVEAIAVNFLWGFVNPVHERAIKTLAAELYGDRDIYFSFASEMCPVVREYARSNTVIINAFLGRTVQRYIDRLEAKLAEAGYRRPLLLMQANGGVVHREELTPIGTLGSGPSGGVIASKFVADAMGHTNVITTDMGGTSFDVGLITDGHWHYLREPVVNRFHITWPMIAIDSIGAGGGTIAWIDPVTGRLRVGPKSAAADPGPVAYGTGGTEPTVTDADIVLGFIDPDYFLGGRMRLHKAQAEQAIRDRIAGPLGMDLIQAAAGIYDIINSHMSDLIRKQVVTTGKVPEEYVLYAFGGAGPVHAAAFGSELNIGKIYVFPTSAVFSSLGVATADVIHTRSVSYRYMMPVKPAVLNARMAEIEKELARIMAREGFKPSQVRTRRTFYMRYRRQLNELDVEVPVKTYGPADIQRIMDMFERKYEDVYGEGSAYREAGIEVISFQVDAIGRTPKPVLRTFPRAGARVAAAAVKGTRKVFFSSAKKFFPTTILAYEGLRPGNVIHGPAIAEAPTTNVVIPPGWRGRVDGYLNIELSAR